MLHFGFKLVTRTEKLCSMMLLQRIIPSALPFYIFIRVWGLSYYKYVLKYTNKNRDSIAVGNVLQKIFYNL